jgi:hypothetical protein
MVQNWTDAVGNHQKQFVFVSPEFAAKWGYQPEKNESLADVRNEFRGGAGTMDVVSEPKTVRMIEHWTDEHGVQRKRTILVTKSFAARWGHSPKDVVEDARVASLAPSAQ